MANKPVDVEDQYGDSWIVYDEDPAWELVKPLVNKLGLTWIVLPRESLLTGVVEDVQPPLFDNLPMPMPDSIKRVVLRNHRLYDCVTYLKGGAGPAPLV